MKSLIIDLSPVVYRWVFASTVTFGKKNKKQDNGLYNLDEYKDILIYQVINYLSNQKMRFGVDEVILAADSKPYWRNKIWDGYKHGRKKDTKNGIDWAKVTKVQNEITDVLHKYSSFKVIDVLGAEGDDVGFVLSEYLSNKGHNIILHTSDHDWTQNIMYENVKVWETKYSAPTKTCGYVGVGSHEIKELQNDHVIYGDSGDYIQHINAYTHFSDKFKKEYPKMTELKVYPRRHFVDLKFEEKHGVSAYKHPRFGKKSFEKKMAKEGFTMKDFIKANPIRVENYKLNRRLVLPSGVPSGIKDDIISSYEEENVKDLGKLTEYFMGYGIMKLVGKIALL